MQPSFPLRKVYSEPCQTSKMVRFAKIVNNCNPLTISTTYSILDVLQGSEYDSVLFSF